MFARLFTFALAANFLCCTGCVIAVSKLPLTDAETSTLDERLLGEWDAVTEDKERTPVVFERSSLHPNVLLAKNPREPETGPLPMYTTKIGDICCLSMQVEPDSDKPYAIAQYEINAAGDEVLFYILHPRRMANAIEDGELKGRVERSPPPPDPNHAQAGPEFNEILLTDEPKEIAAFIGKHAPDCFVREHPVIRLERVAAAH